MHSKLNANRKHHKNKALDIDVCLKTAKIHTRKSNKLIFYIRTISSRYCNSLSSKKTQASRRFNFRLLHHHHFTEGNGTNLRCITVTEIPI